MQKNIYFEKNIILLIVEHGVSSKIVFYAAL